ncbi:hypothetical protein B9Q01_08155 [Candidatus Marsarchaeota G1 archaeon OSP_D]|uniref:Major facilitator superfamily (MFS) profile domain-containing protein n=1 Tax=Candidatus Marsarchaeota G1 archaeon OSP_D TaxID=1978155 RepID=A0A2R6A7N6_9ARCH|nr:MAG: hypothetical protein B9Q01_08155 [Candidatus Marsarchaeota G1 archaeon OSP_D]
MWVVRSSSNSKVFPSELTVKTLIVYNALQGAYTGYIRIFWQPFVLSLGISLASIRLLETFSGSSGVLSSVLQLFGGRLSDRFCRKLLCTLGSFFLVLCWLVAAIAFVIHRSFLIIVSYLLWSASVLALPVLDAALADNVKESERSRVYSVVLLANVVPASITGFFAGNLATKSGPVLLLLLASLLEGLGLLLLLKVFVLHLWCF